MEASRPWGSAKQRKGGRAGWTVAELLPPRARAALTVALLAQLGLTAAALVLPFFHRKVGGYVADAMTMLGNTALHDSYNLLDMIHTAMWHTDDHAVRAMIGFTAGSCIIGVPLLLPSLLLWVLHSRAPLATRQRGLALCRVLGWFCAIDSTLAIVPFLKLAFGAGFTKEVSTGDMCAPIFKLGPLLGFGKQGEPCMSVEAMPASGMWVMLAAVVVYLLVSVEGSPGHQLIHQQLHPTDAQPTHYLIVLPRPITDCCRKTTARATGAPGGEGVQPILSTNSNSRTNSPPRR